MPGPRGPPPVRPRSGSPDPPNHENAAFIRVDWNSIAVAIERTRRAGRDRSRTVYDCDATRPPSHTLRSPINVDAVSCTTPLLSFHVHVISVSCCATPSGACPSPCRPERKPARLFALPSFKSNRSRSVAFRQHQTRLREAGFPSKRHKTTPYRNSR